MRGLSIEKELAEEARRYLLNERKIIAGFKPLKEGDRVIFPISGSVSEMGEEVIREFEARKIAPPKLRVPLDFIGDIALVREMLSEEEITQLLSKPFVNTILLDRGITGDFRVRDLMWVGGERKFSTYYKENDLIFYIDLKKAYFNPRLSTERARIAGLVEEGETVIDMFAGIGPFPLNIASKKDSLVYGIDINPDAIKMMRQNIELNHKKLLGQVIPIEGDAKTARLGGSRIIMNLPLSSINFLDAALSLLGGYTGNIHLYALFNRGEGDKTAEKIEKRVTELRWSCCADIVKEKDYSTTKVIGFFDIQVRRM